MEPREVYLDNSATTRVDPRVTEAMLPYFSERYGNPNSLHRLGREYAAFALMLRTNFPTVLLRQYAKKSRKRPRTAFFTAKCGKTLQTRWRIRPVENISEEKNLIPL